MYVFYYQYTDGKTYVICARGRLPTKASPIWACNTSAWLVPNTTD